MSLLFCVRPSSNERFFSERAASSDGATLIRINSRDYAVPHGHISLPLSGAEGINMIMEETMQDSGEQTGGAVPLVMVVSGGQTGVDRAALDVAMDFGIEIGGWCPKGRRAADGVIPEKYPMTETHGKNYQTRTKWNVCDTDATLVICDGEPTAGTALTIQVCKDIPKPHMVYQLDDEDPSAIMKWLKGHNVFLLNIAGPRELKSRPIYDRTYKLLAALFELMRQDASAPDQPKDINEALQVVMHTP